MSLTIEQPTVRAVVYQQIYTVKNTLDICHLPVLLGIPIFSDLSGGI